MRQLWRDMNGFSARCTESAETGMYRLYIRISSTEILHLFLTFQECFNPRARRGRDSRYRCFRTSWMFQSTRPQGARRNHDCCRQIRIHVSIHAPAGGATSQGKASPHYARSFNPRARRGRDFVWVRCGASSGSFNPCARRGRDS